MRIFNGIDAALQSGHVLIEDGVIKTVSTSPIEASVADRVIEGGNRVLTPGFIDLHVHLTSHVPYSQNDAHATVVGAVANACRQALPEQWLYNR